MMTLNVRWSVSHFPFMILSQGYSAEAEKQNSAGKTAFPRHVVNQGALCAAYLSPYSPPQFLNWQLSDA